MSRSGSTPLTPAITGVVAHLRQHLALGGPEDQLVGVEDRQHAGQRAVALHAEIAGVVDADEVDAAALDELGGDAVAGAGHHQRRGRAAISAREPRRGIAAVCSGSPQTLARRGFLLHQADQRVGGLGGEGRIVDVEVALDDADVLGQACSRARRRSGVGLGIVEAARPRSRSCRSRPSGSGTPRRSLVACRRRATSRPTSAISSRLSRRSVICGLWRTSRRPSILLRHGLRLVEDQHLDRAGQSTCGRPSLPATRQPVGPAGEQRVVHLVGDLDGRVIEHGADQPLAHHLLPSPGRRCRPRGRRSSRSRPPRAPCAAVIAPLVVMPTVVIATSGLPLARPAGRPRPCRRPRRPHWPGSAA